MKLTKAQRKVLSKIIYNNLHNIDNISQEKYNSKVINALIELNCIYTTLIPNLDVGVRMYMNNLTKGTILVTKDGTRIELYKKLKDNSGWEFIYFMTEGKCGGGEISYKELLKDYWID